MAGNMLAFFVLGREPRLSRAEIIKVLGTNHLNTLPSPQEILLVETKEALNFQEIAGTLGGTIKCGEAKLYAKETNQDRLVGLLANTLLEAAQKRKKKIVFSLQAINTPSSKHLGLTLKTQLQKEGYSIRYAISKNDDMSSAAIVKNKIIEKGADLLVLNTATHTVIGITKAVQPFQEQSNRDFGRPARDAHRGMIPVQLARMLVNIAGGKENKALLDPFCGIGTIPMEAALLGIPQVFGADIDPKAIQSANQNLEFVHVADKVQLQVRDARHTPAEPKVTAIVTEPFLGAPTSKPLTGREISERHANLSQLYAKALQALAECLAPGGILIMTLPAFKAGDSFLPFPKRNLLPPSLKPVSLPGETATETVIYKRADQFVGREILICKKA